MAASFASRLSNLRERKINPTESEEGQLRLTLPADTSQKSTYEPSATFSNTRTSFRLLKGRIDKGQSTEKIQLASSKPMNDSKGFSNTQKITLPEQPKGDLKLVLNDDPFLEEKKLINEPPKIPLQKRIMIAKQPPKEEPKKQEPPKREEPKKQEAPLPPQKIQKQESKQITNNEEKPIRQQEAEQSLPPESENDLIICPQGCGRKFNRKALQKHAKACKLVFMSKRKEFNSEAKRITSKEQANIVKQTKIEQKKKMGATRGKGFDKTKTGENWKAASEDFRAAIKGLKKEEKQEKQEKEQEGGEEGEQENLQDKKIVNVVCQYCDKQFNEVFIQNHLEHCLKKKDLNRSKDRKKTNKK